MNRSRRPFAALAVAGVAVVGLGACISEPSARRVAMDIIESQLDLETPVRECMLDKLEEDWSNGQLSEIAEANENVDFRAEDPEVSEEWQDFVDDLQECHELAGTEDSDPAGSDPADSDPADSEPADTEPADTEPE